MLLPNPQGVELQVWADSVYQVLMQYPNMRGLVGPDWQAWGAGISNSPSLGQYQPPNPYQFDDYVTWGQQLAASLGPAPTAPSSTPNNAGTTGTAQFLVTQSNNYLMSQAGNYLVTQ